MRILFVTASYLPTLNGVSIHIKNLKRSLEAAGHKVFVLAPTFPGFKDPEKNVIRYPSMPNPYVKTYPLGIPIVKLSKIKKIRPQIIHTHHPLIIGKFASYIAEKLSIPLFFTAHTKYEQYLNYYFPQGYEITSRVIKRDLIGLSSKCHTVICPSPETKTRLKGHGILNTTVIFNGVDTELFRPGKLNLDRLTVVFTGRIEKEKNPLFLLDVAREIKKTVPNFEMIIIGNGNLLPLLSQKLIKMDLEKNVRLAGEMPQEIIPNLYDSATLFFTPSVSEVMPLSVIEALSCGLPVVALNKSNLESIITHQKNGLILNRNPKLIAQEMVKLFNDKSLIKNFSTEARKSAKILSVENCTSEIIKLYNEAREIN